MHQETGDGNCEASKLIICEYSFLDEDRDNPGYSMTEVDYYAWTPATMHAQTPNHRLSLRKNLVTGEYEFYRRYATRQIKTILAGSERGLMITNKDSGIEEVVFRDKDFQKAIDFGNKEYARWHGEEHFDEACTHGHESTSTFCPVVEGLVDPSNPKPWR